MDRQKFRVVKAFSMADLEIFDRPVSVARTRTLRILCTLAACLAWWPTGG
jgi:hypothetical protein